LLRPRRHCDPEREAAGRHLTSSLREPACAHLLRPLVEEQLERAVRLAEIVDGQDVRVVQGRSGARFVEEPLATLGVVGELGRQHLHRELPPQRRILGEIDAPHPALAERSEDAVTAQ